MSIVTVTLAAATKPTSDSKVGIGFINDHGKILVTSINDAGLFGSSDIRVGQEITSINGTNVAGMSTQEVKAILQSIPKEITIQTKDLNSWKLIYSEKKGTLNISRTLLPPFLKGRGVSSSKWERIHDSFRSDVVPAIYKSNIMDDTFRKEMSVYTDKQMTKGYYQESHHEKKVINMVHQCAVLANTATLMASNVLAKANALLNPHGIMAQLVFQTKLLPKYSVTKQKNSNEVTKPCGIEFLLIDD